MNRLQHYRTKICLLAVLRRSRSQEILLAELAHVDAGFGVLDSNIFRKGHGKSLGN